MNNNVIKHASLNWNEQGTPVSQIFDDVYFSSQNGLEETRYVFLAGNQLPARFLNHPRDLFVVAETGFGTGLNFLALWQAFDLCHQQHPFNTVNRLHFISCEKFPVTTREMALAHAHWPELAHLSRELLRAWPLVLPGCQRLLLNNGRVILDLWFGDVSELADACNNTLQHQVDAWFLDGFAPAKNPEMWSSSLFSSMAKSCRRGATLATFTSAGIVRRGLQQAGFSMQKRKGFSHKREMLTGELAQSSFLWQPDLSCPSATAEIAIIGGGIAGALLALALQRRYRQITIYSDASAPAQGASGNRQGVLYPLLNAQNAGLRHFFPGAFTFARRYYDSLSFHFEHEWCGVLQLSWDEKSRQKITAMMAMQLPLSLATAVTPEEVTGLAGVTIDCNALYYPDGGWLAPAALTAGLMREAAEKGGKIIWQHKLHALEYTGNGWLMQFANGKTALHQNVVLANGAGLNLLSQSKMLPVSPVAGQVSHIPATSELAALKKVLCYNGYLTPMSAHWQQLSLGASYHRGSRDTRFHLQDQLANLERLQHCLPQANWVNAIDITGAQARCSVRCATRDHLPMIGALPDYQLVLKNSAIISASQQKTFSYHPGLYVLGALGSRGLCSGPLAAEILAAQLCAEPVPLDAATLEAVNPIRFLKRRLLKGRPVI